MKQKLRTIGIVLATVAGLTAQSPRGGPARGGFTRSGVIVTAAPQPAQAVTIQLSADLATAVETNRLNQTGVNGQPLYPNVQAMATALVRQTLRQVIHQYPPPSLKAKQDAAAKAVQDAQAAEAALAP